MVRRIILPFLVYVDSDQFKVTIDNFAPMNYIDLDFDLETKGETILD